jgi:HD-GYP domain-containing protein (c-di-GMP phosphodiesterase class II)
VTRMAVRLASARGLGDEELVQLRRGALLHDIGKLGVNDSILLKPGILDEDERNLMSLHPYIAFKLLSRIAFLRPAMDIPYCHHEKWDGSGYPRGLKGEEIPMAARIFAVVDVWDALRSDRPYRSAWPEEKVRERIRSLAGSQFDPAIVETFLAMDWSESNL